MNPALLVIDIKKDFFNFSPECLRSFNDAIEYINMVMTYYRGKGLPVICIQHIEAEDGLLPATEGFELPESLKVFPMDPHIKKMKGAKKRLPDYYKDSSIRGVAYPSTKGFP